jgi:hypothetical protein
LGAIAVGVLIGLMAIGLQFLSARGGPPGRQIDGRYQVDCGPMVTVPIAVTVIAVLVYRAGCLFVYQCSRIRLLPLEIPLDIFVAACGIGSLFFLNRLVVRYDDRLITFGRMFRRPDTICWRDIREARWVGRYGELLIVWEGGSREIHYWWRGAAELVESLRSHGIQVESPRRPFSAP